LKHGIDKIDNGRRRKRMETAFRKLIDIAFAGRIVSFELDAAIAAAAIGADRNDPEQISDVQNDRALSPTIRPFTPASCPLCRSPWRSRLR
jgi:hypothetical protein